MSPVPFTGRNSVFPRDPDKSPGERDDEIGPGWSWVAVHPPFDDSDLQYRWAMFDTASQAIYDLARCLDDGNPGRLERKRSARTLRAVRQPRQLVLATPEERRWTAFAVYEVAHGVHLTDAGRWFFGTWFTASPRRRSELTTVKKPTIWYQ